MPFSGFSAGGTINPSRIVKLSTTIDNTVLQAAANSDSLFGIAQQGTFGPGSSLLDPSASLDSGAAAFTPGYPSIRIFTVGECCPVEIATSVTAGDFLTADSNGRAVTAAAGSGLRVIGQATETASGGPGILVKCFIQPQKV
jgi:hypothetical protein